MDGGQSQVGIESTVLDLTPLLRPDAGPVRILRPGMIHAESLAAVIGQVRSSGYKVQSSMAALPAPGMIRKHYAPKTKLLVLRWAGESDLLAQLAARRRPPARCHVIAHVNIPAAKSFAGVSVMPHDAGAFARALYAELHRCDQAGAAAIVVEAPPETPEWSAIANRLRRAAA